jgi:hypothetical protein
VGDLETSTLAPGQPSSYVSLLKKIAVEISPGGAFQPSSAAVVSSVTKKRKSRTNLEVSSNLVVTEAWCCFSRTKPSAVWARDANNLADFLGRPERVDDIIPTATWSLTHGPSKLEQLLDRIQKENEQAEKQNYNNPSANSSFAGWFASNFIAKHDDDKTMDREKVETFKTITKPIFPLATSAAQDRIADLLLRQNYPAVLCEGPPGTGESFDHENSVKSLFTCSLSSSAHHFMSIPSSTPIHSSGKTHTIANIVCAYLCQGKRVLVTSKNANALNVLRNRMPKSVQELCVDVTMSELQGMRQLQQTVERLAMRVSVASSEIESEKCNLLQVGFCWKWRVYITLIFDDIPFLTNNLRLIT